MPNTLETIDNYFEQAIKEKKSIVEALDHIFSNEARYRSLKTANTRIQMAGFPFRKTLEDFDFDFQKSIDKDQVMDLATMRFVHNAENVVFLGPPGVGKTHLAVSLGMISASNVVNIKGDSYRLKERKEHMKATKRVNTLFENN